MSSFQDLEQEQLGGTGGEELEELYDNDETYSDDADESDNDE